MYVWMGHGSWEVLSLLVVGIMGTRLEKQTNFLCNFISFHSGMYARAQWVFFISGFSSCTRESANHVLFLTVKYHANLPVRRRRRCGVCATG